MKKYLLGLLAIPFGLIAFSNANNLNVSCESDEYGDSYCNPSYITLNTNSCEDGIPQITLSNFSCEFSEDDGEQPCGISLFTYEGTNYVNIGYYNGEISENSCNIENDNTQFEVHTYAGVGGFNGTLTIQGNNGGNEGGDTGGGGGNVGSLLPGGETALSGAISGLTSTINEFIPLMVYVGLGVLGAVIGFFAIKWLISYVSGKTFSIFKK